MDGRRAGKNPILSDLHLPKKRGRRFFGPVNRTEFSSAVRNSYLHKKRGEGVFFEYMQFSSLLELGGKLSTPLFPSHVRFSPPPHKPFSQKTSQGY